MDPEEAREPIGPYDQIIVGTRLERLRHGFNPWAARYFYMAIFLIFCVMTGLLRTFGLPLLNRLHDVVGEDIAPAYQTNSSTTSIPRLPNIRDCRGGENCLKAEAVLQMSMSCFICYFLMAILTVKVSYLSQWSERIHSKQWRFKLIFLLLITIGCFFIPSSWIYKYGAAAVYISGIYLLITTLNFIAWIPMATDFCQRKHIHRFVSIAVVIGCILWVIYMIYKYKSCTQDIYFLIWTAVQVFLLIVVPLLLRVNVHFLTPAIMSLYIIFLCYSAIVSEPLGPVCANRGSPTWQRILSFLVAIGVLVYSTQSTGLDYKIFRFQKRVRGIVEIPYRYWLFHLLYAIGGMYVAMITIGWDPSQPMSSWLLGSTWTSTGIILITQTISTVIYIWFIICRELRERSLRSYIAEIQLRRMLGG